MAAAKSFGERLSELGCRFALDDVLVASSTGRSAKSTR
jgi:EAL domain-containing protein (putative c-di-GMP-specific phosphodiesterase class I)